MRAISIRPPGVRRNSTSLTVISNFAAGSYAVLAVALAAPSAACTGRDRKADTTTGRPAAPSAVIFARKSRRPEECVSMRTSLQPIANGEQQTHYLTTAGIAASTD